MTGIYWADVSPLLNDAIFEAGLNKLPEERKQKVLKIRHREDKNLSIGAWLVFTEALKAFPGYNGTETIAKEKNGKPYFKDNENVHFSLSHSGNIAFCAVSCDRVGVDTQIICDFKEGICRRYFTKNERDFVLKSKEAAERKDRFFRIWTLKEAYAKMTGGGLGEFRNFEIKPGNSVELVADGLSGNVNFEEFDIPGYKTAVCYTGENDSTEFKRINLFKLLIN